MMSDHNSSLFNYYSTRKSSSSVHVCFCWAVVSLENKYTTFSFYAVPYLLLHIHHLILNPTRWLHGKRKLWLTPFCLGWMANLCWILFFLRRNAKLFTWLRVLFSFSVLLVNIQMTLLWPGNCRNFSKVNSNLLWLLFRLWIPCNLCFSWIQVRWETYTDSI